MKTVWIVDSIEELSPTRAWVKFHNEESSGSQMMNIRDLREENIRVGDKVKLFTYEGGTRYIIKKIANELNCLEEQQNDLCIKRIFSADAA